jgi:hypothetical protein
MTDVLPKQEPIRSTIPARLDRLGWSPFHTRMVAGLGGGVNLAKATDLLEEGYGLDEATGWMRRWAG